MWWFLAARQVLGLQLIPGLPNLKQADGGMEPVEDGHGHGDVRDNGPGPNSEELEVGGTELRAVLFQRVDCPHGHVGYDQEGDHLAPWLHTGLLLGAAAPPPCVQYEHGLYHSLQSQNIITIKNFHFRTPS